MSNSNQKRLGFSKKGLVAGWVLVMVLSLVLLFALGNIQSTAQGLLLVLVIIGGWSLLFFVILVGFKQRHLKKIIEKNNQIILNYQQERKGPEAIRQLEALLETATTIDEVNFVTYHLAYVLWETGQREKAKGVLDKIIGTFADPGLHEEYLWLKKALEEGDSNA